MKMEKCILKYHGNLMKLVDCLKFSLWNFERWNPWTNSLLKNVHPPTSLRSHSRQPSLFPREKNQPATFSRAKGWNLRIWDGKIESQVPMFHHVPSSSIMFKKDSETIIFVWSFQVLRILLRHTCVLDIRYILVTLSSNYEWNMKHGLGINIGETWWNSLNHDDLVISILL